MKQNLPNIERGLTRINVLYLDGKLSFAHPFAGPNNYQNVAKQILNNKTAKMSLPDGEKTSFLLHATYCGPKKFQSQRESVELRDEIMKQSYLWPFQRNLWVPEIYKSAHGVFVVYDENGVGTSEEFDIGDLERSLKGGRKLKNGIRFSEDGRIGFAPRNTYKEGEMNAEDFAKDGFIIASNKEQGARNLAKVSKSEHFSGYELTNSSIINPKNKPIQTISLLSISGASYRLDFCGDCYVGYGDGHSLGVLE